MHPTVQLSSSFIQLNAAQEQVNETEFKADIHSIGRIEQIGIGTYMLILLASIACLAAHGYDNQQPLYHDNLR